MKSFDIDKAKSGHPICTRVGKDVEILRFNFNGLEGESLMGIVKKSEYEFVRTWFSDGSFLIDKEHPLDLFLKSCQKEGWVNVYDSDLGAHPGDSIYDTKEEALDHPSTNFLEYLDTVKIKWEE